jgi:hypothetical protein
VPSGWKRKSSWRYANPQDCKITQLYPGNLYPLTPLLLKEERSNHHMARRAHHTFSLGLFSSYAQTVCGFSGNQILQWCQFTHSVPHHTGERSSHH